MQLVVKSIDGSTDRVLFEYPPTLSAHGYSEIDLSPTGSAVSILYWQDAGHLQLISIEGEDIRYVDTNIKFYGGVFGQANWSPDGSQLVFSSQGENTYVDLYTLDADGESLEQLTNTYEKDSNPVFLPDGGRILFVREELGWSLLDVDSGDKYVLNKGTMIRDVSPDGQYLLSSNSHSRLYLTAFEGRDQTQIARVEQKYYLSRSKFSPNGRWILYSVYGWPKTGDRDPNSGYYWYLIDIEEPTEAYLVGAARDMVFSPDEKSLLIEGEPSRGLFASLNGYWAFQLDSHEYIELSQSAHGLINGIWIPGSDAERQISSMDFIAPTPQIIQLDPDPKSPIVFEAESMKPMPNYELYSIDEGEVVMLGNGYIESYLHIPEAGTYRLDVVGRGSPVDEVYPLIAIEVGDDPLGVLTLKEEDTYSMEAAFEEGLIRLRIRFTNDAWSPSTDEDRNAWIDKILITYQE